MKFYILLILNLIIFSSCNNSKPESKGTAGEVPQSTATQVSAKKAIVFFGNSLTAAYNLSPEEGFPALIQEKIDSLGLLYTCVNAGLSGETSAGGNARIDWVLQQPVDIFVLELGGNDALRGLDVAVAKRNLQSILDKVKAKNPQVKLVIAGMLAPPNMGKAYTDAFKNMYIDLAKTNEATLIPFLLENVAAVKNLNLEDGIHPNAEGQKIVAENVWKVLKPLI